MTHLDLSRQRLVNQHLAGVPFDKAEAVVQWLGAVQAQEYLSAKWALAQRTANLTDAAIEQAFNAGALLRTHALRPTWHFVTPDDIGWLLDLTGPHVHALNAYYYRQAGLDTAALTRSADALLNALRDGAYQTRDELKIVLERQGFSALEGPRLAYIFMYAELEGLICSGPRRGNQFTYAVLAERAPQAKTLTRDAALAELTRRYFTSHGPATLRDYRWWSGLPAADAQAGLDMVKSDLGGAVLDGKTYWFPLDRPDVGAVDVSGAYLIPVYDEYFIAYKDRRAEVEPPFMAQVVRDNGQCIVIDGEVVGTWRREVKGKAVNMTISPFTALTDAQNHALAATLNRYSRFIALPVTVAEEI